MNTIENAEQDAVPTLSDEDPTSAAEALREGAAEAARPTPRMVFAYQSRQILEKADPFGMLRRADETIPHGGLLLFNLMARGPFDLFAGMSPEQVAEVEAHAGRELGVIKLDADPYAGMTPEQFAAFKALIGAPLSRSRD